MHQYMKSIGFGNIRDKKQLTQILKDVEESYTQHQLVTQDETTDLCEFEKEYGEGIGIKVCGDMDIDEQFEYRYYTPYFKGSGVTSYADVSVERRIDREAYVGICGLLRESRGIPQREKMKNNFQFESILKNAKGDNKAFPKLGSVLMLPNRKNL